MGAQSGSLSIRLISAYGNRFLLLRESHHTLNIGISAEQIMMPVSGCLLPPNPRNPCNPLNP